MSAEVQHQFTFLFLSLAWGMGLAWIYDGLRLFRKLCSHSKLLLNIEDLFFWIGSMAILFDLIFTWHYGEIRSYIVVGVVSGALFYLKWISPVYLMAADFLLTPLKWILKVLGCILGKMKTKTSDKH